MTDTITAPPEFADLKWSMEGPRFVAQATRAWWALYEAEKGQLRTLGLRCETRETWVVIFDPARAAENHVALLETLQEAYADRIEAAREQERLDEIGRQRAAERVDGLKRFMQAETDAAKAKGQATIDKWGMFTVRKATLMKLLAKEDILTTDERKKIERIVRDTDRKAAKFIQDAIDMKRPMVDWSEGRVVDAIHTLTGRDLDRATLANNIGWSAADSSWGHWCAAMLKTDRELAIKVARTIVGPYEKQLETSVTEIQTGVPDSDYGPWGDE